MMPGDISEAPPATASQHSPGMKYVDDAPPKKLTVLGLIASGLLVLTILANIAVLFADQRYIGYETDILNGHSPSASAIESAESDLDNAAGAYLTTVVLAAAGFIAWFYRAYRNLPRRGLANLRHGPGWAIGAWFVPILALFRPKQIANDIWRGSFLPPGDTRSNWTDGNVPSLLHWWWGTWISGSIISWTATRIVGSANSDATNSTRDALEQERTGLYGDQLAAVLLIISAILAIMLIRRISERQDQTANVADRAAPGALSEETGQAGVHEDSGSHSTEVPVSPPITAPSSEPAASSAVSDPLMAADDPPDGGHKICPECAEEVKQAARKCRYCGFRFAD